MTGSESMDKQFYRPDEVATLLKVSVRTVYKLINRIEKPLPCTKLNSIIRIPVIEYEQWLIECQHDVLK